MAKVKERTNRIELAIEEMQEKKRNLLENERSTIELIDIDIIKELSIGTNGITMHNRISYSQEKLKELAFNIKEISKQGGGILKTGVIHPVMLRRKEGVLERIHGDNRIKAVKLNGDKYIPAIIFENISDELARFIRSSENLNRDDLNPYDFVLSILEHIQLACNFNSINDVKKFINKAKNQKAGKSTFSKEEEDLYIQVSAVFSKIPRIDIISFVDRLSILNVNDLIKQAMVDGYIGYMQAIEINKKLKDEKKIEKILSILKSKKMTKTQLKAYISNMLNTDVVVDLKNVTSAERLKQANKKISLTSKQYSKLNYEKKQKIDEIINKIESLYENINIILTTIP